MNGYCWKHFYHYQCLALKELESANAERRRRQRAKQRGGDALVPMPTTVPPVLPASDKTAAATAAADKAAAEKAAAASAVAASAAAAAVAAAADEDRVRKRRIAQQQQEALDRAKARSRRDAAAAVTAATGKTAREGEAAMTVTADAEAQTASAARRRIDERARAAAYGGSPPAASDLVAMSAAATRVREQERELARYERQRRQEKEQLEKLQQQQQHEKQQQHQQEQQRKQVAHAKQKAGTHHRAHRPKQPLPATSSSSASSSSSSSSSSSKSSSSSSSSARRRSGAKQATAPAVVAAATKHVVDWRQRHRLALRKAGQVATELVETEKTYVSGLGKLKSVVERLSLLEQRARARKQKGEREVLSLQETRNVFQNVCDICEMHIQLSADLNDLICTCSVADDDADDDAGSGVGGSGGGGGGVGSGAGGVAKSAWAPAVAAAPVRSHTLQSSLRLLAALGKTLLLYTPFFRVYTGYVLDYEKGVRLLNDLRRSRPDVAAFFEIEETLLGKDLESVMITPVQRIPRYLLLLKELLKVLPSNDDDDDDDDDDDGGGDDGDGSDIPFMRDLRSALQEITKIAEIINGGFKRRAAREQVVAIDKRVTNVYVNKCLVDNEVQMEIYKQEVEASSRGRARDQPPFASASASSVDGHAFTLVTPTRFLVKQGLVYKKHSKRLLHSAHSPMYVFLFNDLLVVCKVPMMADPRTCASLECKQVFDLHSLHVTAATEGGGDDGGDDGDDDDGKSSKYPYRWLIRLARDAFDRKASSGGVVDRADSRSTAAIAAEKGGSKAQAFFKATVFAVEHRSEQQEWLSALRQHIGETSLLKSELASNRLKAEKRKSVMQPGYGPGGVRR
jgi:hypothetical protein